MPKPTSAKDHPNLVDVVSAVELQPKSPQVAPAPPLDGEAYVDAPPGAATRIYMDTAGIFSRRRKHRFAAVLAVLLGAILVAAVILDLRGAIELPGMGAMYDVAGLEDPNVDRAISRTKERLQSPKLSVAERKALRLRLLGLSGEPARATKPQRRTRRSRLGPRPAYEVGIEEKRALEGSERALAAAVFGDARKSEQKVRLAPPREIQAPNLPNGLTREAIFKVISENNRSMSLCISKGMKAGEKLTGKMEVELTISAKGRVDSARIATNRFQRSAVGRCTVKTVKRWRFPRFNGEPVAVVFPYVLSAGF